MTQPIQPPPQPQPVAPPPQKRKRFGWLALILTAVVALGVGGAVGGAGDGTVTTAAPAPTVTVTEPAVVEGGNEPTTEAPEPEPTKPATFNPKPAEFKVTLKVTEKQCFGSAGCNVSFTPKLAYAGTRSDLPAEGVTSVTYEVSGAEDPFIGTLELSGDGTVAGVEEQSVSTKSSSAKLSAKVTEVDYNEFG